jgi:hypothetical protein
MLNPVALLSPLSDLTRSWQQNRRRVRVLVHTADFMGNPGNPQPYYFVKVTNLSNQREVEITHVWFATHPRVDMLNPARPLPARLRLDETWEGWIAADTLPVSPRTERLARVLLSNGKIVKSRLNRTVPPVGYVAGAGVR